MIVEFIMIIPKVGILAADSDFLRTGYRVLGHYYWNQQLAMLFMLPLDTHLKYCFCNENPEWTLEGILHL